MKYCLITLLLSGLIIGCRTDNTTQIAETPSLISKYLNERVAATINVEDDIVLRFNQDFSLDQTQSDHITFSPKINGTYKWIDANTFVFDPDEHLDYDKEYVMTISIGDLINVESESNDLKVKFRTKPLQLDMQQITHKMSAADQEVTVIVRGAILSNQYAAPSLVESTLKADFKKEVRIDWNHANNGRAHDFEIIGIEQKEVDQLLKLKWNGGRNIKGFAGAKNITIKAEQVFAVDDVVIHNDPTRHIVVLFSRPLDEGQDLNGLIKINEKSESIKTLIDGNTLTIYPDGNLNGTIQVYLSKSVKSFQNIQLESNVERPLTIEPVKPELRLTESGVIVPSVMGITFPFEAINIDTVDVEIFKIYEDNVLQFMQDNDLSGSYNLNHVGKMVHQEKISIKEGHSKINTWRSVALDLKDYISEDPDAIYQVRLGFRPMYVSYECADQIKDYPPFQKGRSIIAYQYYGYDGWDNPCSKAYYTPDKYVSRNVILSNVTAIIKKGGANDYYVSVNKISDGVELSGATITFYNYQKLELGVITTDARGMGQAPISEKASFAVVQHQEGVAYLDLRDANTNSIADFNTGGKKSKNGIDAFIYSDRGVYRPGDTIFLHAMIDPGEMELPTDHPVTLVVKDAQSQQKYRRSTAEHLDHIYTFQIPTDASDPTGAWNATLEVGSSRYSKRLSIETVKPNRLRVALDMDDRISYTDQKSRTIGIKSSWLHGAPATDLRAKIDAQWSSMSTRFEDYKKYEFSDPARQIQSGQVTLYDGKLDQSGEATFELSLGQNVQYPSMLRANITNRVFEKGGDFSENYGRIEVSPYSTYIGVSMPENRWGSKSVKIGDAATAQVVSVDENGEPVSDRRLSVGIYDINWRWWYYRGERRNIYELNSDQHSQAIVKTQVTTGSNGEAVIPINTDDFEYGRKLIRVCDLESRHCTGTFFYASGWRASLSSEERSSLSKLTFASDQESYQVGDEVTLNIPSEEGSRILISIEGEDNVIMQDWISGVSGSTPYQFRTDRSMAPNVYAHVSLVQSYDQDSNDLPIRMYGVIPIIVADPESELTPQISMADELKPKETFSIGVTEASDRPMNYTIAIVDEGLLDLTNFQTPHPHGHFYAKRSLGVKTWDAYDDILYGLNGAADKIISIGGDGEASEGKGQKKAIRFKPVVFSAGPFALKAGERSEHTFKMPNYVGSVRAMVIAKEDDAYGRVSETVPVKTPLMVLPTVPRVISQGEQIKVPVSVFGMRDDIRKVEVKLTTSDNITPIKSSQSLTFTQQGEQVTYFDTQVGEELGIAKIDVTATSGSYRGSQQIEVDIRNPNPVLSEVTGKTLQPGETWQMDYQPVGVWGTNEGTLELSLMPSVRLADRIDYLVNYPYGCLEQTTSSAFVQLYLKDLTDYVTDATIDRNINAGIKRLLKLQNNGGSFKYWPSSRGRIHEWSSSYAGHFLIEAKKKGYYVSNDVLDRWASDQKTRATRFTPPDKSQRYQRKQKLLIQAYRLYTLSLYGDPDLSAMNNLRSTLDLPKTARFLLGAAYAISAKPSIALELIQGTDTNVGSYRDRGYTYGSEVRDMALIAQALSYMDREGQSLEVVNKMVDRLNSGTWYSTQSIAFGLMAVGKLSEDYRRSTIQAAVDLGSGATQTVNYNKPIFTMNINPDGQTDHHMEIRNTSDKALFVTLQLSGQKSTSEMLLEKQVKQHLAIDVNYKKLDGSTIDVSKLKQGTDFLAEVNIRNLNTLETSIDELALTQIIPSGWEIRSGRLNQVQGVRQDSYEYRDIRDNRVHTFFDLTANKKYVLLLNATYEGTYFLPPVSVEAMYDKSVSARTQGSKVQVVR